MHVPMRLAARTPRRIGFTRDVCVCVCVCANSSRSMYIDIDTDRKVDRVTGERTGSNSRV